MCISNKGCGCMKPEDKIVKPECCPDEQIRKCHGDVKVHPCVEKEKPAKEGKKKN